MLAASHQKPRIRLPIRKSVFEATFKSLLTWQISLERWSSSDQSRAHGAHRLTSAQAATSKKDSVSRRKRRSRPWRTTTIQRESALLKQVETRGGGEGALRRPRNPDIALLWLEAKALAGTHSSRRAHQNRRQRFQVRRADCGHLRKLCRRQGHKRRSQHQPPYDGGVADQFNARYGVVGCAGQRARGLLRLAIGVE